LKYYYYSLSAPLEFLFVTEILTTFEERKQYDDNTIRHGRNVALAFPRALRGVEETIGVMRGL
jgi:hypothetical protein